MFGDYLNESDLRSLAIAGVIILSGFVLRYVFGFLVAAYFRGLSKRTESQMDDILAAFFKKVSKNVFLFGALILSVRFFPIGEYWQNTINVILSSILIFLVARNISGSFGSLSSWITREKDPQIKFLAERVGKIVIWMIVLVLLLGNWGVNIGALTTGLGVSGIIIGLAVQDSFAGIISSIALILDKPFEVGDVIKVGEFTGKVVDIGFRSTTIKTSDGQTLSIPNINIAKTEISNFSEFVEQKRRITGSIGVTYETTTEELKKAKEILKKCIVDSELVDDDSCYVHFSNFNESSLELSFVFYVNTTSHWYLLDEKDKIFFAIKESFDKEGIVIAYPTRTIWLQNQKS